MPGYMQQGLPVPSLGYKTLMYNCNALYSVYFTFITAAFLHYYHIFRLTEIIDNYGHIMSVAMIWGFAVSFGTYFWTVARGEQMRMSGNFIYDVFMGAALNPRIGPVDLKMWAEVRIPWVIVFFLAVSGACKQYEQYGAVTPVCAILSPLWIVRVEQCSPEYGIHVSRDLALSKRMVSSDISEIFTVTHFALEVAKVKSVFHRHGICSTKSGASWLSFGILPEFHS
jgi:ergosterol biosynthesis ERG4/ERG24 family protein